MKLLTTFLLWLVSCSILCAEGLELGSDPRNNHSGRDCELAVACVFQNEMPWLREWIEFHRLVGATHFYLYNNNSTDNYQRVLNPYIESGVVELYHFTGQLSDNQEKIYGHALSLANGQSKWVALIDTDEFVFPLVTDNLVTYLSIFQENVGALEINWQCFGTSNIWSLLPGELLIDKLTLKAECSDPMNRWQKSIVRPEAVKEVISAHQCSCRDGYRVLRLTPVGPEGMPLDETGVQAIRVHHYLLRTKEFFYRVKYPRIQAQRTNLLKDRSPSEYMQKANKIEDRSIHRYVPRLKDILFRDSMISPHGYWLGNETSQQHRFDSALAHLLIEFFKEEKAERITDFGCGVGDYVWALKNCGFSATGVDGNPNTPQLTNNAASVLDLCLPVTAMKEADWGLCLAIGEAIDPEYETILLENLANHSTHGLILSWPGFEPGGEGKEKNELLSRRLSAMGFRRDPEVEKRLRMGSVLVTFKNNIMVFRK